MEAIINFLNNNGGVSILIASIATLVSALAVAISLYYNAKTQNQYKKSLEPQLSMRLDKYTGVLYLLVQNTGRSTAEKIKISVESIENNGSAELMVDPIFSQEHELYPNEAIQATVAISGDNVVAGYLYPKIKVRVSYCFLGTKKAVKYSRAITHSKGYDYKVLTDVNIDLKDLESSLKATARAAVRTANYLDGYQVSIMDDLNIINGRSIINDIFSAIEFSKSEMTCKRKEIPDE